MQYIDIGTIPRQHWTVEKEAGTKFLRSGASATEDPSLDSQVVPGNGMRAERQPHSQIDVLTLLLLRRRRRRESTGACRPVTLLFRITIVILVPAFVEDIFSLRSRLSNGLFFKGRHRVADGEITMVQRQRVQQSFGTIHSICRKS